MSLYERKRKPLRSVLLVAALCAPLFAFGGCTLKETDSLPERDPVKDEYDNNASQEPEPPPVTEEPSDTDEEEDGNDDSLLDKLSTCIGEAFDFFLGGLEFYTVTELYCADCDGVSVTTVLRAQTSDETWIYLFRFTVQDEESYLPQEMLGYDAQKVEHGTAAPEEIEVCFETILSEHDDAVYLDWTERNGTAALIYYDGGELFTAPIQ